MSPEIDQPLIITSRIIGPKINLLRYSDVPPWVFNVVEGPYVFQFGRVIIVEQSPGQRDQTLASLQTAWQKNISCLFQFVDANRRILSAPIVGATPFQNSHIPDSRYSLYIREPVEWTNLQI